MRLFSLLFSHREIDGALLFLLAMGSVALIVASPTLKGEEMRAMICAVLMMSLVGCERYCPTVMLHDGEEVRAKYIGNVAHYYQPYIYRGDGPRPVPRTCTWLRQDEDCNWVETGAPEMHYMQGTVVIDGDGAYQDVSNDTGVYRRTLEMSESCDWSFVDWVPVPG